jgi:hypothetical protein
MTSASSGISVSFNRMCDVGSYIATQTDPYKTEDILCLFDLDMTLTQPDHPAAYVPNLKKHLDIYRSIQSRYPKLDTCLTFCFNFLLPQRLTDNDILSVLALLKMRTIAFTATVTGDFLGKRMEVRRYEDLKRLELSFEHAFPQSEIILNACPRYRGYYPTYYKGVLFSNSERGNTTKGTVLCAFLDVIRYVPKCVVLVDDRPQNHFDVQTALSQTFPETKYIGIEFTGAANYCPKEISAKDFEAFYADHFERASKLANADTETPAAEEDLF